MKKISYLAAISALALASSPVLAQTNDNTTATEPNRAQDRLNAILGTLFGNRAGSTESLDAQWSAGRMPLAAQRGQFESRIDTDVRSGALDTRTGNQLKSDYYALVQLEARYGADGRFTTSERSALTDRYGALTQILADRGYGDDGDQSNYDDDRTTSVAEGRLEFNRRVDASVAARRLTRVQGTRLKRDYATLVRVESGYLRDTMLSSREREDLDARLDALDERVGDVGYGGGGISMTPSARLAAIASALPSSGLNASAQAQLRVEHGDLTRLADAYAQRTPSADDRAYLDRRLVDLEARARVRIRR